MSASNATPASEDPVKPTKSIGSGKSSKVIDKIMSENDRLRRELKLAMATLEEEKQRGDSARAALEASRTRNATIEAICEANDASLQRRDRKIIELSANLGTEQRRRKELETALHERDAEIESLEEKTRVQLGEESQTRKRIQNEHDVLQCSLRQIEATYLRSLRECQAEFLRIKLAMSGQANRIDRIDALTSTLAAESETLGKTHDLYRQVCDKHRQHSVQLASDLRVRSEEVLIWGDSMINEMDLTLHKLKWSLALSDVRNSRNK